MAIRFGTEGFATEVAHLESVVGGDFDMEFGGHAGTWVHAEQTFEDEEYDKVLEIYDLAVSMTLASDLRLVLGDDWVMLVKSKGVI